MDSDKNDPLTNRQIIAVLSLAIGTLGLVYYLVKTKNFSNKLDSGQLAAQEHPSDRAPTVEIASTAEIDLWIRDDMRRDSRPLAVVNVWATWCEPCRKEMPEIAKFQREFPGVPVFLASADNESDLAKVQAFLTEAGIDFPSRLIKAPQDAFIETWQNRSSRDQKRRWSMSLPVTFFLNSEGEVEKFLATETNSKELAAIASGFVADPAQMKVPRPENPDAL